MNFRQASPAHEPATARRLLVVLSLVSCSGAFEVVGESRLSHATAAARQKEHEQVHLIRTEARSKASPEHRGHRSAVQVLPTGLLAEVSTSSNRRAGPSDDALSKERRQQFLKQLHEHIVMLSRHGAQPDRRLVANVSSHGAAGLSSAKAPSEGDSAAKFASHAAQVVSASTPWYDGSTPTYDGTAPTKGDLTHYKDWDLPNVKWAKSASSPDDLEGADSWRKYIPQDQVQERKSAASAVRDVDNSVVSTLLRLGEGVGPITYSRSPGAHQSLNRELRLRLVAQDDASVLTLLFVLGIAVWMSCLGVYQFADDPSQVVFYSDPKYNRQRMFCSSPDQDAFLEAFNSQPSTAMLRIIGRRPSQTARSSGWFSVWTSRGQREQGVLRSLGRFVLSGRRRGMADANVTFDVSLDLTSFIAGGGQLASEHEVEKLDNHIVTSNPLEIVVLRKRVVWVSWEDVATNIKQKLRSQGFEGELEVRFDSQEDMKIYRNSRWQNFVRTPITHILAVLSGIGLVFWLPYLYVRSDIVTVESHFHIDLDLNRYWDMLSAGLDAEGGFNSHVA